MNVKVQDQTGEIYVNLANKNAEPIIGMPCEEFKNFKEGKENKEILEYFFEQQYQVSLLI